MTTLAAPPALRADTLDPLWVQAADAIAHDIASGELPMGARLPAERELCQRLSISRVTLRKALQRLVDDGLVMSSHGRGWFVGGSPAPAPAGATAGSPAAPRNDWPNTLESFSETADRLGLVASSRVLRAELAPATLDEAEELQVAPGALLFHLDRVRLLDGVPIASDRTRVPAALVPGIERLDFAVASLYDALAAAGLQPSRAETTIEARESDDALAADLGIEPGHPVLVMHELVHAADERPVFASEIRYAGDRYRLRTVFTRHSPRRDL